MPTRFRWMRPSRRNSCLRFAWCGGLVFAARASALAQSPVHGSHCIVFVPGTIHGELARCARLLERDHPLKATTLTLSLGGTAPNHVQSIALSLDGAPAFQNLPVDAAP